MFKTRISSLKFGEQLKLLRERSKISRRALAVELQLSASYISLLETEQRRPKRDLVLRIGHYFFPEEISTQDQLLVSCGFLPQNYEAPLGQLDRIEIHREILAERPDDFKAYLALVLLLIRSDKAERAQVMIEKGMETFDELAQLQSLLASLELSKDNLDTAIQYQESAIKYFRLETAQKRLSLNMTLSDLLLGLGIMHFIKSNRHMILKEQCLNDKSPQKAAHEHHLSETHLTQARLQFTEALAEDPSDIYTLDEMARVIFNQAFLLDGQPEAPLLWQEAINGFEKIIQSRDKHVLGSKNLMETNVFMAHAYTKARHYDKALYLLNIIEAAAPDHWLVYYAKACYYSLKSETLVEMPEAQSDFYKYGLDALRQGMCLTKGADSICKNAPGDPDLKALREHCPDDFENMLMGLKHLSIEDN